MSDKRDPRGRKPTCFCGECRKCRNRTYGREYMRERNSGSWVPRRPPPHKWSPEDDALLGTDSDLAVAQIVGVSQHAVCQRRRRLGVPAWRPPARRAKGGYLLVWARPDDPLAAKRRRGRRILEHRLVMARHLGRPLREDEIVHHRNGIPDDNRIENLELWTRQHPDGQRVEDILRFCREFLSQYGTKFA